MTLDTIAPMGEGIVFSLPAAASWSSWPPQRIAVTISASYTTTRDSILQAPRPLQVVAVARMTWFP